MSVSDFLSSICHKFIMHLSHDPDIEFVRETSTLDSDELIEQLLKKSVKKNVQHAEKFG